MDESLLPQTPTNVSAGVNLRFEGELIPNLFTLQQKIQEKSRTDPFLIRRKRYLGKASGFLYYKREPMLTLGPDWALFLVTWTIFLVMGLLVTFLYVRTGVLKYLTLAITLFESFVYLYTGLKNPGISTAIDRDNITLSGFKDYPEYCNPCGLLKDKSTNHCLECNVCVKGFDHHCPWTGKCIGAGNIGGFQLFILSTFIYIIYLAVVIFIEIISATPEQ